VGRHSSPEQSYFIRSVFGWFLPWVLVAAVAGVAVWIAVGALGQGELDAAPPRSSAAQPTATPTPTKSPPRAKRKERPPKAPREDKPRRNPERRPPKLITAGVTVQVLNATTEAAAGDRLAARLADLGFQIAVVGQASRLYDRTTVFWSYPAAEDAASALATRFGWQVEAAPANLSRSVALHVVVGLDES
jgi:hypothetical protein